MLKLIILSLFISYSLSESIMGKNYLQNPSFENGNWYKENNVCIVSESDAHTGTHSLYCNKKAGDPNGFAAQWGKVTPGLYYKFSGYFKIKSLNNLKIMFYAECGEYGIWTTQDCKFPCVDEWQYFEYTSVMSFNTNGTFIWGVQSRGDLTGTGEFWIDDIKLEPVIQYYLRSVEVLSYKQEVFADEVEVLADCTVDQTMFEKGDHLQFKLEVISQSNNKTAMTIDKWTFEKRTENYVAVFKLNPKKLEAGFYTLKVTMKNEIFGTTETKESNMHKLKEKRTYKRYIDKALRVVDDGKLFFPMGIYTYTTAYEDAEIAALADSKINLVVGESLMSKKDMNLFYEKSGKKIRVISIISHCLRQNTTEQKMDCVIKRVEDLKDSPALFAYYLIDEPGEGSIPIMRQITLKIREMDPDHFVYCAINRRQSMHLFKEGFDVVGNDNYPVQHFDVLHSVVITARQSRERLINSRAQWNIPQFFDWTCNGFENESSPTLKQLRHMTYQFIVGGATGLIYYSYGEMKKTSNKVPIEKEFAKLKTVMDEIVDEISPIIMSGLKINPKLIHPKEEDYMCYVRFFRYDGYDYILAVNAWANRQIMCKFSTSPNSVLVEKISGDSKVELKNGKFEFNMPAMDIVWLKVEDDDFEDIEIEGSGTSVAFIIFISFLIILLIALISFIVYRYVLKKNSFKDDLSNIKCCLKS